MAIIPFLPSNPNTNSHSNPHQRKSKNEKSRTIKKRTKTPPPPAPVVSSWEHFKNLLSCKNANDVQPPVKNTSKKKYMKLGSTCGASICSVRDVVHGSTTARVADQGSSSDGGSHINESTPLSTVRSGRSGMNLMKFSGCYECHAVDVHSASRRYPRSRTMCPCTECGEVFTKSESLEIHQAIQHAVSELGPEDSSRNIVEIIFKSSWLNKDPDQICTISRILKVHNTQSTTSRFEEYRDSIKIRAQHPNNLLTKNSSKNPRCAADGNELLRFYSTSIACSLGSNGSTSLCLSSNQPLPCGVCQVIRIGLELTAGNGVGTYASSGRAHELGSQTSIGRIRAMLVCRVIAGKVKRIGDGVANDDVDGYDSFSKDGALEDLFVHNPMAVLPCFVVIYKA